MTFRVQMLSMGTGDVPGPELFWMAAWNEWFPLAFQVALIRGSGITALVGTRDLGQEVYIALTKANPGNGLVAGLAIAFIAIIADRLLSAAARSARAKLGLEGAT